MIKGKRGRYWKKHFEAWQASGLSQAEYARQNGLRAGALSYWKQRFSHPKQKAVEPIEIVPVPLENMVTCVSLSPKPIKLCVGKYHLEIEAGFCKQTLRELLSVLEE